MLDVRGLEDLQKQKWGIKTMKHGVAALWVCNVPVKAVMLQSRHIWMPRTSERVEDSMKQLGRRPHLPLPVRRCLPQPLARPCLSVLTSATGVQTLAMHRHRAACVTTSKARAA